ncbi:hypothetical protein HPP92_008025 [Vanilla planifolia]|uniref:Uncharacterized protein n=1 Tax=Vanilla planifolia TaxID=51239 RepID=A0A835RDP9_VANPL|nr:hypothetical protein HPP92_008025 [Vanilla planifolia]
MELGYGFVGIVMVAIEASKLNKASNYKRDGTDVTLTLHAHCSGTDVIKVTKDKCSNAFYKHSNLEKSLNARMDDSKDSINTALRMTSSKSQEGMKIMPSSLSRGA